MEETNRALQALNGFMAVAEEEERPRGGPMPMGDADDQANLERNWLEAVDKLKSSRDDADQVGALRKHARGLTAQQAEKQQVEAAVMLRSTKSTNSRRLFKMAIGSQILQNVNKTLVGTGSTMLVSGLPVELQASSRLIRRFGRYSRISVVTLRDTRALVTFADSEGAVEAMVDPKLQEEGMTVQAVDLTESHGSKNAALHDMILEHREKITQGVGFLAKATAGSFEKTRTLDTRRTPQEQWRIRMGLDFVPPAMPGNQNRGNGAFAGATLNASSMQIYADAVVAAHLPDREREWRLRDPTSSATRPLGGRVITLKEEIEFDSVMGVGNTKGRDEIGNKVASATMGEYVQHRHMESPMSSYAKGHTLKGWDVRINDRMRLALLIKKLRQTLGQNKDGAIVNLVTVQSEFGKRAMGRHVIMDSAHLVHGQTYLIRRGALSLERVDEAEEEERVATWLQRTFKARCETRVQMFPDRYLRGWGLATREQLVYIRWIQNHYRKQMRWLAKYNAIVKEAEEKKKEAAKLPDFSTAARPLKPEQAVKMQDLATLPVRLAYTQPKKPDVAKERPILRSAHEIFTDRTMTDHKRWTRAVPAPPRAPPPTEKANRTTARNNESGRSTTTAASVRGALEVTRSRPSSATVPRVTTTNPIRLSIHDAGQRRPQSARADFSATKASSGSPAGTKQGQAQQQQQPSLPPRDLVKGRAVSSAPPGGRPGRSHVAHGRRRQQGPPRGSKSKHAMSRKAALSQTSRNCTFGDINQRGGSLYGSPIPSKQLQEVDGEGSGQEGLDHAAWWLEEQARARQRPHSARAGEKPAWDSSTT